MAYPDDALGITATPSASTALSSDHVPIHTALRAAALAAQVHAVAVDGRLLDLEEAPGAPAETSQTIGNLVAASTAKTTPADGDMLVMADSAASNLAKKITWAQTKAALGLAGHVTSTTSSGLTVMQAGGVDVLVVSDTAPDDGDGRPDGTIYIQVS